MWISLWSQCEGTPRDRLRYLMITISSEKTRQAYLTPGERKLGEFKRVFKDGALTSSKSPGDATALQLQLGAGDNLLLLSGGI